MAAISDFDFVKWQDDIMKRAEVTTLNLKVVPSAAFLYAFKSRVPEALMEEIKKRGDYEDSSPSTVIGVMLPMSYKEVADIIRENPLPGLAKEEWAISIDALKAIGGEGSDRVIVERYFHMSGTTKDDIEMLVLAKALLATKAIGYVRVSAGLWQPEKNRGKVPLREDKDLRKAIISVLETETSCRALVKPYYLDGVENEQVLFGDAEEVIPKPSGLRHFMGDTPSPPIEFGEMKMKSKGLLN